VLDHERVDGSLTIFILGGLTIPGEIFSSIVVEAFLLDGISGLGLDGLDGSSGVNWCNIFLFLVLDLLF
jgi:hypothetical protein